MKKTFLLAGLVLLMAIACGRSEKAPREQDKFIAEVELTTPAIEPAPPSEEPSPVANGYPSDLKNKPEVGAAISSIAARGSKNDTAHRFVRTADLRFRVKDVVKATLGMEDIVGVHGGWVTASELRSTEQSKEQVQVSEDSTLEITRYQVVNELTVRVPNTELDSTLRQMGCWVDLFEQRSIHADDVRLKMLANSMAGRRARAHALRVARAIASKGKKLDDITDAEDAIMNDEARDDQEALDNLDLDDRIAYSNVVLYLYERPQVRRELVANVHNVEGFRPSMGTRLLHALDAGWRIVENVLVALLSIWPLAIAAAVAAVLILRRSRRTVSS